MLFSVVVDLYYATLPVGKIQREIATGHWDLMRLTTIDENALVITNYVLTQRRAQRMVIAEEALRYICIWLVFWNVIVHGNFDLALFIAISSSAVPFALQPVWRMEMLMAVGVACGVRVSDYNTGILTTFPVIIMLRMAELTIIFFAYALIAGSEGLGALTMLAIIPLGGWLDYQLWERTRGYVLNKVLHLSREEIASTRPEIASSEDDNEFDDAE
jgi:hypothetical protein